MNDSMNDIKEPLYQKIYNDIVKCIETGEYSIGDRVPSEMELAEKFGVSRITSKKALKILEQNGLIERMRGRGSFVKKSKVPNNMHQDSERNIIGLVIPDFSDSYATEIIKGIEVESSKQDIFIILKRSLGGQDVEEKILDDLLTVGISACIIMPVHGEHYNSRILKMVFEGIPTVFVDRYLKGIPAPFVGTDNVAAAKMATDYLIKLGHKNISFISPTPIDTSTIVDRMEGIVKSHAEHGVAVNEEIWITNIKSTVPGNNQKENVLSDIEIIKDTIQKNPQVTCIFADEYNIALLAEEAVKSLGKNIPDDISVLCFDAPYNFFGNNFFTHIQQNQFQMGQIAVRMLMKCIENKNYNDKKFLQSNLIIGKSTKEI